MSHSELLYNSTNISIRYSAIFLKFIRLPPGLSSGICQQVYSALRHSAAPPSYRQCRTIGAQMRYAHLIMYIYAAYWKCANENRIVALVTKNTRTQTRNAHESAIALAWHRNLFAGALACDGRTPRKATNVKPHAPVNFPFAPGQHPEPPQPISTLLPIGNWPPARMTLISRGLGAAAAHSDTANNNRTE